VEQAGRLPPVTTAQARGQQRTGRDGRWFSSSATPERCGRWRLGLLLFPLVREEWYDVATAGASSSRGMIAAGRQVGQGSASSLPRTLPPLPPPRAGVLVSGRRGGVADGARAPPPSRDVGRAPTGREPCAPLPPPVGGFMADARRDGVPIRPVKGGWEVKVSCKQMSSRSSPLSLLEGMLRVVASRRIWSGASSSVSPRTTSSRAVRRQPVTSAATSWAPLQGLLPTLVASGTRSGAVGHGSGRGPQGRGAPGDRRVTTCRCGIWSRH
jgi:hypothetical protein